MHFKTIWVKDGVRTRICLIHSQVSLPIPLQSPFKDTLSGTRCTISHQFLLALVFIIIPCNDKLSELTNFIPTRQGCGIRTHGRHYLCAVTGFQDQQLQPNSLNPWYTFHDKTFTCNWVYPNTTLVPLYLQFSMWTTSDFLYHPHERILSGKQDSNLRVLHIPNVAGWPDSPITRFYFLI